MYDMISMAWVVFGGLLEPVWLFALKKSDSFRNKGYGIIAIVFMLLSPLCLSFAMKGIPVGISYAIWTGIGAVCAIAVGAMMMGDKVNKKTGFFVILIIVGAIGLAMMEGA